MQVVDTLGALPNTIEAENVGSGYWHLQPETRETLSDVALLLGALTGALMLYQLLRGR